MKLTFQIIIVQSSELISKLL